MTLEIYQFPCLSDNYGVLIHDGVSGATVSIDAPDAAPVLAALTAKNWKLTEIWVTHHHMDHVQGIPALKAQFPKAQVTAPASEASRITALNIPVDRQVKEGDIIYIGTSEANIIATPGHTAGHIVYYFSEEDLLFAGDTLFAMGCGRVFETPAAVMWDSLCKLAALPEQTQVYCGHEYTLSNARFALTIEPGNTLLQNRAAQVTQLRQDGHPTVPTTIGLELATNPFLRAEEPTVQQGVGMHDADAAIVFAEIRERKNRA